MDRDGKRIRVPFYRKRKSLFLITFTAFFTIILLSSSAQLLLFNLSIKNSVQKWIIHREFRLEREAMMFLMMGRRPRIEEPFIILDKDEKLIFSNRRDLNIRDFKGKFKPLISHRGELIGYYGVKGKYFRELEENRKLLETLYRNLFVTAIVSLIMSLLVSYLISKRLSKSTIDIRDALQRIENGDDAELTPSGSREIYNIGEGVNRLSEKLKNEANLRSQWLHDISHDLKTPLSGLKLQYEGMLGGILSIDKERARKNKLEVDRLESLIMGLNDLMKFESPDLKLNKTQFNILDMFSELEKRFEDIVQVNGKIFTIVGDSAVLFADYNLIFKALSNLIENAIQYSHEDSDIILGFSKKKNEIFLTNMGEGIPEEKIKNIFNRLYRGDFSRNSSGSGLGLSITKAIMDKHKWDISATSEKGVTRFSIKL